MNNGQSELEVLPAGTMQARYGLYAENARRAELDPATVPESCRPLVPLAEMWGIGDDLTCEDFLCKAPKEAIRELKDSVRAFEDALDEWLAGPKASSAQPSAEYLAFTCMRVAADEATV